jgi:hypothetical protein
MGSGVAAGIKYTYPGAYSHYRKEYEDTGLRLGTNNIFPVSATLVIVNAIGQEDFGSGKRFVSYDAIQECFEKLNDRIANSDFPREVHIPMIGCGLGGGSWTIIKSIIEDTSKYPVTVWTL